MPAETTPPRQPPVRTVVGGNKGNPIRLRIGLRLASVGRMWATFLYIAEPIGVCNHTI